MQLRPETALPRPIHDRPRPADRERSRRPARLLGALTLAAATMGVTRAEPPSASSTADWSSSRLERRLVRWFDFNEAAQGNFESMPIHWAMHSGAGFPRYLTARFDEKLGHEAAPSFYLGLLGGNVGGVYQGIDIPVHPGSDYRIVAWIRPDRLRHARASLTAWYRDGNQAPLPGSERRSLPVGGSDAGDEWQRVTIDLPGGQEAARTLALGCWVKQPELQENPADEPRPIRRADVAGGAWFDDIYVVRMPRLDVTWTRPAALFEHDEPVQLRLRVDDPDRSSLTAHVALRDSDGATVRDAAIPIGDAAETLADLSPPEPGWYRARVTIRSGPIELMARELSFVRLPPDLPLTAHGPGFGVLLGDWDSHAWRGLRPMLRRLGVSAVKAPFWTSATTPSDLVDGNPDLDRFLHDLHKDGVDLAALLAQPPAALAATFEPRHRSLPDILSAPPERWRAFLTLLLARYGDVVRYWQIGDDADVRLRDDPRRPAALARVQSEIEGLAPRPVMAAPWSAMAEMRGRDLPTQYLSLTVPAEISAESVFDQLAGFRKLGYFGCWATIEPLAAGAYAERPRLADFAKRLVLARAASDLVFVPGPWDRAAEDKGTPFVPRPEFLVVRALAQATAGAVSAENISRQPEIAQWLFRRADGSATMIAWRESASRRPVAALGFNDAEVQVYDLFGRRIAAAPVAGSETPESDPIGFEPVILAPIDSARAKLHAALRLARPDMMPGVQPQPNQLLLRNTRSKPLTGRIELRAPRGWQVSPPVLAVSLRPDAETALPLTLRLPSNEPGGERLLRGVLRIGGDAPEVLNFELPVRVGVADLDVTVLAHTDRGRYIVVQRVTNRSGAALDFEGSSVAGGRRRLTRLIRQLAPGETAERTYEYDHAAELRGHSLRISLQEIDGPRRHNEVLRVN